MSSRQDQRKLPLHSRDASSRDGVTTIRGKRSDIEIRTKKLKGDEHDDMEALFDDGFENSNTTTARNHKNKHQQKQAITESSPNMRIVKKNKKKTKTPKSSVRMSLPGHRPQGEEGEDSLSFRSEEALSIKKKIKNANKQDEVSPVATAPPTPRNEQLREEDEDDDDEASEKLSTQPEEEEGEEKDDAEDVAVSGSSAASGEKRQIHSPDDDDDFGGMPVGGGYDDYDGSDMGDHLGEASSEDESIEQNLKPSARQSTPNEMTTPKQTDLSETESDDDGSTSVALKKNRKGEDDDEEGEEEDEQLPRRHNVVHDPETPKSERTQRAEKEKAQIRGKKKTTTKKRKQASSSSSDDEEENMTPQPRSKQRKKNIKKTKKNVNWSPGVDAANREYKVEPIANYINEDSPEDKSLRRSKRARCPPLQYWKNEKQEYGPHNEVGFLGYALGSMPVVKSIVKAEKTPKKMREVKRKPIVQKNPKQKASRKRKSETSEEDEDVDDDGRPFDSSRLRRKHTYSDGEEAIIWDEDFDAAIEAKVISYQRNIVKNRLPQSTEDESKMIGLAGQAFNIPNDSKHNYVGYIMGNLTLPPGSIKDSESVGPCAQTFTVCSCQPGALEVAYGDAEAPSGALEEETAQRYLLSPGDMFRVPPGNSYRLENHSETTMCICTWTIIRPVNDRSDG